MGRTVTTRESTTCVCVSNNRIAVPLIQVQPFCSFFNNGHPSLADRKPKQLTQKAEGEKRTV